MDLDRVDRDRDVNMARSNLEAPRADVTTEPDLRRSMIMGRGLDTASDIRDLDLPFVRNEQISPMAGDEMRWGSIWGGFLTYFVTALTVSALMVAIGAVAVSPATEGAASTIAGTAAIVVPIIMLLATFVGGLVAGWTANLRTVWGTLLNGLVYGALVVAFPVLVALFTMSIASGVAAGGAAVQEAAAAGQQLTASGLPAGLDSTTVAMLAGNVGWFSLGSILILAVGILGTWLGMRGHLDQVMRHPIAGGLAVTAYDRHLREDLTRRERHSETRR